MYTRGERIEKDAINNVQNGYTNSDCFGEDSSRKEMDTFPAFGRDYPGVASGEVSPAAGRDGRIKNRDVSASLFLYKHGSAVILRVGCGHPGIPRAAAASANSSG